MNIAPRLLLGSNEPSWGCLTSVSLITRAARDTRLKDYTPIAMPAFRRLQERDTELRAALGHDPEKKLIFQARRQATTDMRQDITFLGGTNEVGLAFRVPAWSTNKPCFLCFGMMGYQSAVSWAAKDQDKYMSSFD